MSDLKSKYELIKYDEDEQYAFKLTEGKFKDVIYKYNRFGIIEPESQDDEVLNYKFEYDILEIPEEIREKKYTDEEGKEFEELIGDILIEMIQENIENKEKDDDTDRRYNFKEPDLL